MASTNPLDAPRIVPDDPTAKERTAVVNASPHPVKFSAYRLGDARKYTFTFEPWETQEVATEWVVKPKVRGHEFGQSIINKLAPQLVDPSDPVVEVAKAMEKDHREVTPADASKFRVDNKKAPKGAKD